MGDWKWYRECFGLEEVNYNCVAFCFKCLGAKIPDTEELSAFNYDDDAPWTTTLLSNDEFMEDKGDVVACKWPGFGLFALLLDLMHILCLGTFHHDIGATIWALILEKYWYHPDDPTTWKESAGAQLARAYLEFTEWAKHNRVNHGEWMWDLNKIGMSALSSRPYWSGKAATNLAVARWLRHLARLDAASKPHHVKAGLRANFWWGIVTAIDTLQRGPLFVSLPDAILIGECRKAAFNAHRSLHRLAVAESSPLWHHVPKHHMADHVFRECSNLHGVRFNPCSHWCFIDEDFVGKCAKLCAKQHAYRNEIGCLQRWLLHLLLELADK